MRAMGCDAVSTSARQSSSKVADAWERAHDELVALIVREAGRTMLDAHLEVREAIDFCRYYAALGRSQMKVEALPGPAGESNELRLSRRGACSSASVRGIFRWLFSVDRLLPRWWPATRRCQTGGADAADRVSRGHN